MPILNERTRQLAAIRDGLGGRHLIWFGSRGEDARPLLALPEFSYCFSRFAPLEHSPPEANECLETISGVRVDHNTYDPQGDTSVANATLQARLQAACDTPAAIVSYKSEEMLTRLSFVRNVRLLNPFHEYRAVFDHKPWVETELRKRGLKVLPWRYLADNDPDRIRVLTSALREGPLVLRNNRSLAGTGLRLVNHPNELALDDSRGNDGFEAYAPFIAEGVPLNTNACVFADGSVTVHSPSLQLIGIPSLTSRVFGYCGNDFAAAGQLEREILDSLEEMTLQAGAWLHSMGYVGSFGVDALVAGAEVYLVEVNPRFQGSSEISAGLSDELDIPNVYMDHIASCLHLLPQTRMPLRDQARRQTPLAQVFCYNGFSKQVTCSSEPDETEPSVALLPAPGIRVAPNAVLFRALCHGPITRDGMHIEAEVEARIKGLAENLFAEVEPADFAALPSNT
jgi:ATP-grasp domain